MKDTKKLKKRSLQDGGSDGKRVVKMKKKKNEKVSNVENPQETRQAVSVEKPKRKKVELKKKIQKSKKIAEEIISSPVDSKLSGKLKKRKEKEVPSNEKVKGNKGKVNKTKKKRKADEITPIAGVKDLNMADNGTEIRTRKSKKSNKKKKMDLTSTKENKTEEDEDVYQISSGDEDCSRGMKKWVTDYYESRPGLEVLQERIDEFMTAHEERLEQERQTREAKAAEGGWTVVVHHKGRKKTTEAESGTAVGSVSRAALEDKVAKKKQSETVAHGFYRFQRREAQRNELLTLQSKFEQDKKRIQQLRAARRFKPF